MSGKYIEKCWAGLFILVGAPPPIYSVYLFKVNGFMLGLSSGITRYHIFLALFAPIHVNKTLESFRERVLSY